jgi:hypothetical protein
MRWQFATEVPSELRELCGRRVDLRRQRLVAERVATWSENRRRLRKFAPRRGEQVVDGACRVPEGRGRSLRIQDGFPRAWDGLKIIPSAGSNIFASDLGNVA